MINRNVINTPPAPHPARIPRSCKYGVGIQNGLKNSNMLDVSVYDRERKLLIRFFIEKDNWLIYNNSICKWDKRTIEYILFGSSWYNFDVKDFYVRGKEGAVIQSFLRKIGEKVNKTGFDALISYINLIRAKRNAMALREREERKEALLEKTIKNAPDLPEDIDEYIRNNVMLESRYLFFETKRKKKYGYCTHCRQTNEIPDYSRHKENGKCPGCGSKVTLMASKYSHNYLQNENTFTIMQSVEDTFYIRTFSVQWNFKDHIDVKQYLLLGSISYYNASEKACFNFVSGWFKRQCGYSFSCNGVWYYNTDMFHDYGTVYPLSDHKLFSSKIYRYAAKVWQKEDLNARINFLVYQDKIPYVEMLLNSGFTKMANGVITCRSNRDIPLNLKGKTITDVFRLPRQDMNLVKKHDLDLKGFKLYKKLRKEAGLKCNDSTMDWVKKLITIGEDRFFELMKYSTPQKLWNYFLKQNKTKKEQKDPWKLYNFMSTWSDYIKICEYLEYDLSQSIVLYPRNLDEKHDEVVSIKRQIMEERRAAQHAEEDRINNEFIGSIAEIINRQLAYDNDNYHIRAAETVQELVHEGNVLSHCVGGYADRIKRGNTAILFVRSKDEPDKPLCTVEYLRNQQLVGQCSGYKNKLYEQSVIAFIDEWKEVKKIA